VAGYVGSGSGPDSGVDLVSERRVVRSEFTNQSSLSVHWSNGSISPVVRLKFYAAGRQDLSTSDSDAVLSGWRGVGTCSIKGKLPNSTGLGGVAAKGS
jgi:hypothetical protein